MLSFRRKEPMPTHCYYISKTLHISPMSDRHTRIPLNPWNVSASSPTSERQNAIDALLDYFRNIFSNTKTIRTIQ